MLLCIDVSCTVNESIKTVYKHPFTFPECFGYKPSYQIFFFSFKLERPHLQNSQILIRRLEEKLHTHMFKWCFHGYKGLDLQFVNLPSVDGKTHSTFPKIWVLRYRHCLPMQWIWNQALECSTKGEMHLTCIANLTYCCGICLGNLNEGVIFGVRDI